MVFILLKMEKLWVYNWVNAVKHEKHDEILRMLKLENANIDLKCFNGLTALLWVCRCSKKLETIKLLIDCGANVDFQTYKGITALMLASLSLTSDIVDILLTAKANINIQNDEKNTALILASVTNEPKIVKMLLAARANINIQNNYGNTALMLASSKNKPEIVKMLLAAKANINIQNNNGKTALMFACVYNNPKIIKILLDAGANPMIVNIVGQTSYQKCYSDSCRVVFKVIQYQRRLNLFSRQFSRGTGLEKNIWKNILQRTLPDKILDLRALGVILNIGEDERLSKMTKCELRIRIDEVLAMCDNISPSTIKRLKKRSRDSHNLVESFLRDARQKIHIDSNATAEEVMHKILHHSRLKWPVPE